MTRKRLTRIRKQWNASRRILRGWQHMRWDVLMDIVAAHPEVAERERQLRCIARQFTKR